MPKNELSLLKLVGLFNLSLLFFLQIFYHLLTLFNLGLFLINRLNNYRELFFLVLDSEFFSNLKFWTLCNLLLELKIVCRIRKINTILLLHLLRFNRSLKGDSAKRKLLGIFCLVLLIKTSFRVYIFDGVGVVHKLPITQPLDVILIIFRLLFVVLLEDIDFAHVILNYYCLFISDAVLVFD